MMRIARKTALIVAITSITLMSGLMNLYTAIHPARLAPPPLWREMIPFEQRVGQLEKQGVHLRRYDPPFPNGLIGRLREVSDEWLRLSGKRERTFILGRFEPSYLRTTPIFTAEEKDRRVLAFVNLLPSYYSGEVTVDLMRHRMPDGLQEEQK